MIPFKKIFSCFFYDRLFIFFQQQKNGVDFLNQNIVRMTIHHALDFSKVN